MPLSPQEVADRLEIQDLLVDYAHAIDSKQWDLLDDVFTPDAHIDYTAMGGAEGNLAEIKDFLAKAMPMFPQTQHLVANMQIRVHGDEATGRIMCHNPQVMELEGKKQIFFLGLWYLDKYVRTPKGWRICERIEQKGWAYHLPGALKPLLGDIEGE
jgi:3-phenylpropionate/cinnamic acid dioxygenase small subunit